PLHRPQQPAPRQAEPRGQAPPRQAGGRRGGRQEGRGRQGQAAQGRQGEAREEDGREEGGKGMSKHLKRLASPRSWVIPRKTNVYTTKPRPGAHPVERALPLATVVRDFLKLTETGREARRVIGAGEVQVDGRTVKDAKFAVGF